jgi:hypothetical protein
MKPIEGAESGGALGFFKGVGQGLVGAVTKPVVGVFDLASNVTEGTSDPLFRAFISGTRLRLGIRNTTTVFDSPGRDRVRYVSILLPVGFRSVMIFVDSLVLSRMMECSWYVNIDMMRKVASNSDNSHIHKERLLVSHGCAIWNTATTRKSPTSLT